MHSITMISAGSAVVMVGCAGAVIQEQPVRPETFTVAVRGSEQARATYAVSAIGLESNGNPTLLVSRARWSELVDFTFDLRTYRRGELVAQGVVRPWICARSSEFRRQLLEGWLVHEYQEVYLNDNGALEFETDFDHGLRFWCERMPKDVGNMVVGEDTIANAPPLCADPDRAATDVTVAGDLWGESLDTTPEECLFSVWGAAEGPLQLLFTIRSTPLQVSLVLESDCLQGDEAFPLTLSTAAGGCRFKAEAGGFTHARGKLGLANGSGTWVIGDSEFGKKSRASGALDVTFTKDDQNLRVVGSYSLPVLRVPLAEQF